MREERPDESGGEAPGADQDVAGRGGEGQRAEQVTPPIADDTEPGRTSSPAEEGDVGVPPDEEMDRPDE